MIHPETNVYWLNCENQRCTYGSISGLYKNFAHLEETAGQCGSINFARFTRPVLLKDWNGWTQLLRVTRDTTIEPKDWVDVVCHYFPGKRIVVGKYELIPAYDQNKTETGFHGETKYYYELKHPMKIDKRKDSLRIGDRPPFGETFQAVDIGYSADKSNPSYGFEIITRSGFYNANGFHLYGKDTISVSEIQSWGWK